MVKRTGSSLFDCPDVTNDEQMISRVNIGRIRLASLTVTLDIFISCYS